MAPIKTTIHCNQSQYPLFLDMFMAQAEQRMLDAGAINITDMRYRIVREPFGIEFAAQANKAGS